uniref:Zygote arrest 1 n=1 Tax=Sphenodon punctatus TaxID=8508 RepID=A0A8D0HMR2_SPHPU
MASLADEAMENYMYSPYNPYSYRYQPPKGKGAPPGVWRPRGSYFPGYGESAAAAAAAAAEYFDNYQRAQLKAILAQVNPGLTPRLRKANTKEVGVQVNPRQDASVQCSLGPRTLLLRRGRPDLAGSPATGGSRPVRFPRTIAVYSPMASRRLTTFLEEEQQQPPPREKAAAAHEEAPKSEAAPEAAEPETQAGQQQQLPQQGDEEEEEEAEEEGGPAGQQSKTRVRFQFLEQKYGYYHCKDCNIRWESAYVWCVQGTNKVYFRQFCRTCQKSYNPYRVEDIACQSCKQTRCICPVKARHVDPKRPHRQDLCGRCKGKRLSCDSTFSFKYII